MTNYHEHFNPYHFADPLTKRWGNVDRNHSALYRAIELCKIVEKTRDRVFKATEEAVAYLKDEYGVRSLPRNSTTFDRDNAAIDLVPDLRHFPFNICKEHAIDLSGVVLSGWRLDHSDFGNMNLDNARFICTRMNYVNLRYASLLHADFSGADLFYAAMTGSKLDSAIFKEANLENAQMNRCRLSYAYFRNAKCKNSRMSNAIIKNADFQGAYMEDVKFHNSDLRGSNFNLQHLEQAVYRNANLEGANFWRANQGFKFNRY